MQVGTGWLGWTEAETLATSIPTIELAYEGLLEKMRLTQPGMLGAVQEPFERSGPPSPEVIFAAFRSAGKSR